MSVTPPRSRRSPFRQFCTPFNRVGIYNEEYLRFLRSRYGWLDAATLYEVARAAAYVLRDMAREVPDIDTTHIVEVSRPEDSVCLIVVAAFTALFLERNDYTFTNERTDGFWTNRGDTDETQNG